MVSPFVVMTVSTCSDWDMVSRRVLAFLSVPARYVWGSCYMCVRSPSLIFLLTHNQSVNRSRHVLAAADISYLYA